uniref:Chitotriosidase-1 n=1 Tax=Sparus aurata TaxID=8175 RepID=A0A671V6R8_SPAAU
MARLLVASASKLVCHMTNWAQYRPGGGKFTPANVDPFLCTHVIYSLATINSFNQLSPIEWNDEQQYGSLNSLKNVNPALKTLLSVGGTVNGMSPFISMVAKPESRAAFIRSAISYLRTHNFDGLNLAWEYPGHNGSPQTDRERFSLLVQELSKAFEDDAKENRMTQLLLSASVAAFRPTIDKAYEVNKIALHLDFINVMTYDFHGSWEAATGHNSPLFPSPVDSGSHIHHNINSSLSHWLSLGAPAEKLLLGFPTYGRTFRLSTGATGLGAPANGPADAGPYTRTDGFWSYYEICSFLKGTTIQWIEDQKVPYAAKNNEWVGFDNRESYEIKVRYMQEQKFGGAFVWALDLDDFAGRFCGEGSHPLLAHLRSLLNIELPPLPPTTTPRPGASTTTPPTTTTTTTHAPGPGFCNGKPDGLYANPDDKTSFYMCAGGITHVRYCGTGSVFDESCKCCVWP